MKYSERLLFFIKFKAESLSLESTQSLINIKKEKN